MMKCGTVVELQNNNWSGSNVLRHWRNQSDPVRECVPVWVFSPCPAPISGQTQDDVLKTDYAQGYGPVIFITDGIIGQQWSKIGPI